MVRLQLEQGFRVIYLWQGERHVHSRIFRTLSEAAQIAYEMRLDGWQAWAETLGR